MPNAKAELSHTSNNIRMLVALVSIFFFGLITYGYYNLSLSLGWLIALFLGILAALIAWWLARFVGENWRDTPVAKIFGLILFAISGAGVFNTFMLVSEGPHVLVDATYQSDQRITALQNAARRAVSGSPAAEHLDKIDSLTESLMSEIRNPLNCGQGPEARRLIAALQAELPGFTALSGAKDCTRNDAVVADYRKRIDELKTQARWPGADLVPIVAEAERLRANMAAIRNEVQADYTPPAVRHFVDELETQNGMYQRLRSRLAAQADVKELDQALPLSAPQNLGTISGLLAIIFQRAGEIRTWSYLLAAAALDWGMCTLFALNKKYRAGAPRPVAPITQDW